MGLLAMSRWSLPAALARLTEIWQTSACRPWAVRAATAAESVSSAMAEMQMRAAGLRASAASTTAARFPLVPPMKTASGAGRFSSAAGAVPSTNVRLRTANFSLFWRMRAQASGSHSTAYTRPRGAAKASSTLTLPVPAPTSQSSSPGWTPSFASTAARTSCLVIGTLPRAKASSGRPWVRRDGTWAASTSSTLRLSKRLAASWPTVPV